MRQDSGRLWSLTAAVFVVAAMAPVLVVFSVSLRPQAPMLLARDFLPPASPSLASYREVLREPGFLRAAFNSFVVTLWCVAGNIMLGSLAAWALTKQRGIPLRATMFTLIFAIALPQQATVVPLFLLFQRWSLLDTFAGIILPGLIMPVNVLVLYQGMKNIPQSLLDAAMLDGAGARYCFRRVVLPLVAPSLGVVTINTFMASWSAFLLPFLLTTTAEHRTLPVALALLKTQDDVRWSLVIAGAALTALPVVLLFLLAHRKIVSGLTAGGVKG
jgi:ABC-type glycerol-3-phosphate transport system permease component